MKVSLVSLTSAAIGDIVEGQDVDLSPEQLIVYVARVSNPANQMNSETAPKLIAYLVKNKHWSPFEMADMTVEIITSRGIAQQILRHRSFSFQEFSQRYAKVTEMEPVQLRYQADKNRQSSSDALSGEDLDYFSKLVGDHNLRAQHLYEEMLHKGVAKESARFVLPITTQTKIYMKGSVRSWIHYLQIRCDQHTQQEHREIANAIAVIFRHYFPATAEALSL